jgi:hypothetical protein
MKSIQWHLFRMHRVAGICFFCAPILAACGKPSIPVSIHGVNYSVEPFSFVLKDPVDPKNEGGGELVDSYAAGGTTCCYELPKKWRPGIKVSIQSKHWVGRSADDSLHDIESTHLVEIPQYADGKPGELWVLRSADGSMNIVSSDVQPDHPNWPGKIKGWPIPSLAYQRERWNIYIVHQEGFLHAFTGLQEKLRSSPNEAAHDAWAHTLEYDKQSLTDFSGPDDPKYRKMLKQDYEKGIQEILTEISRLRKGRP